MENKSNRGAMWLAHVGGLIVVAVILAGTLPFLYMKGIVYFGFGWIKGGILAAGLVITALGFYIKYSKADNK